MVLFSVYLNCNFLLSVAGHFGTIHGLQDDCRVDAVIGGRRGAAHLGSGIQEVPLLGSLVVEARPDINVIVKSGGELGRRYYIIFSDIYFILAPLGF